MSDNAPSLKELADDINASFDEAEKQDIPLRVEIGSKLLHAKKEVEATRLMKWEAWCQLCIKRSMGDIRKVIALAQAEDPFLAVQEEREKARQRMAEARKRAAERHNKPPEQSDTPENRANVCAVTIEMLMMKMQGIEILRQAWSCVGTDTQTEFRQWIEGEPAAQEAEAPTAPNAEAAAA